MFGFEHRLPLLDTVINWLEDNVLQTKEIRVSERWVLVCRQKHYACNRCRPILGPRNRIVIQGRGA
jgi:hypothetical protein